jgi:gas vesicle protein
MGFIYGLIGFLVGAVVAVIVSFFVAKNNQGKLKKAFDLINGLPNEFRTQFSSLTDEAKAAIKKIL